MRRSLLVFILFLLMIGAILAYNTFVRSQPPLTLVVAADPSIEGWVSQLADAFNARRVQLSSGSRIQIAIDTTNSDVSVWQGRTNWTSDNHPEAWLATAGWIVENIPSNLTFVRVESSLATSPLVWGGFESRVTLLTDANTQPLDWAAAQAAAVDERWQVLGAPSEWGFVNIGIPWPRSSAAGINTLASLLGSYAQTAGPSSGLFADNGFRTWFAPLKQAMQNAEQLGESPPRAMATRGAVVAGFAIAPEFQWLTTLETIVRQERVVLAYPSYNAPLNFPLSLWQDSKTLETEQQGIRAFADFVNSTDGQAITLLAGLRPTGVTPNAGDPLFANAQQYGVALTLPPFETVTTDRSLLEQLFRLMD